MMESDEVNTVPTASDEMLHSKSKVLNGSVLANHKHHNNAKNDHGRRHRSKSEGHELHHVQLSDAVVGGVVKAAKDKTHDRKPRSNKGRGLPKKGETLITC